MCVHACASVHGLCVCMHVQVCMGYVCACVCKCAWVMCVHVCASVHGLCVCMCVHVCVCVCGGTTKKPPNISFILAVDVMGALHLDSSPIAMGGTSSTEASKKELDIGISAALLMAIRTKSRAAAATGAASTSTTTSTTAHNAPSQNSDTDVVARQHFASNNSTMTSASSSERAHNEPRASAEGFQGQKTLPLAASEHTTSTSSIHSEHSEDSRSLSCSGGGGGASPLTDWDFEGMTAEDWVKWSKEVGISWGTGKNHLPFLPSPPSTSSVGGI